MARWDPRYGTTAGYAAGEGLINLAQLLRQGFGDYHRQQTVDEESQRRDQDYLLRLQQFLSQNEDRDLDRQVRTETLGLQRETAANTRADRQAAATLAATGRSGLAKLVLPKATREETVAGLTPEEAGHKDVVDLLTKLYPVDKPKAPEPFTLGEGQTRFGPDGQALATVPKGDKPPEPFTLGPGQRRYGPAGEVLAEVPATEKPEPINAEQTIRQAARAALIQRGTANPTDEQIATEAVTIKERLGKAGAAQINLTSGEREKNASQENVLAMGNEIRNIIRNTPGLIGGPMGVTGRTNTLALKFSKAPKEFARVKSVLGQLRAELIHELTGANIGPKDQGVYLDQFPSVDQSDQEFESNLEATIENVARFRGIRLRQQGRGETGGTLVAPPAGFRPVE